MVKRAKIVEPLPEISEWPRIDESRRPESFFRYLEDVSKVGFMRINKNLSYRKLNLKSGDHVLDVGCGTGNDVRRLAKLVGQDGLAVGVDRSRKMIKYAREATNGPNIRFRVADVEELPFSGEEFDACRCERLFVHLDDPDRALSEIIRVTKKGGRVCVIDVDWETLIVDSKDRRLTRTLLNMKCDGMNQGWIGRRLFGLFRAAELEKVRVSSGTFMLDSFSQAREFFGLEVLAHKAVQVGLVSKLQAYNWLDDLRKRDKMGCFFASSTGFNLIGVK